MSDTVRFETNKPAVVALKFAEGLAVSSKFSGDQVMFTLVDDRRMYVAPTVADKIRAAGVQPGEYFSITKQEVQAGNRRTIQWAVETGAPSVATSAPALTHASLPTPTNGAAPSSYVAPPAPAPVVGAVVPVLAGPPCGAAHPPAAAVAVDSSVALMKAAGRGAVDVVLEVEQYARSRGLVDFAFDPASIQDLVVSLFISLEKKGARA